MSTPEIRAIVTPLSLTLFLFVFGILADDHHFAVTLDHLALLAHFLNRRFDFHDFTSIIFGCRLILPGM